MSILLYHRLMSSDVEVGGKENNAPRSTGGIMGMQPRYHCAEGNATSFGYTCSNWEFRTSFKSVLRLQVDVKSHLTTIHTRRIFNSHDRPINLAN
mmetsp:Transcript_51109/g.136396  ORF Transcript_51109/g.136396 Transcript_51109/m.136396 type:complete len:95 (-) Transcript_51109:2487-2771(-)